LSSDVVIGLSKGYGELMNMTQNQLRGSLYHHLQYNHYPPVPVSMIDVCIAAIDAINEEEANREIPLPEGVFWRNQEFAPAWAICSAHHLDGYLYDPEDEDDA
jgi:hypothetical protein